MAAMKPAHRDPPRLDAPIAAWFRDASRNLSARVLPIGSAIAVAAAEVPLTMAHRDPGDCYIIATAKVRNVAVITRDRILLSLAARGHFNAIAC